MLNSPSFTALWLVQLQKAAFFKERTISFIYLDAHFQYFLYFLYVRRLLYCVTACSIANFFLSGQEIFSFNTIVTTATKSKKISSSILKFFPYSCSQKFGSRLISNLRKKQDPDRVTDWICLRSKGKSRISK